jgi:hypothetical protein
VDNDRYLPDAVLPNDVEAKYAEWAALMQPGGLLEGLESFGNSLVQRMASPTGFEPVF